MIKRAADSAAAARLSPVQSVPHLDHLSVNLSLGHLAGGSDERGRAEESGLVLQSMLVSRWIVDSLYLRHHTRVPALFSSPQGCVAGVLLAQALNGNYTVRLIVSDPFTSLCESGSSSFAARWSHATALLQTAVIAASACAHKQIHSLQNAIA